MTKRSVVFAAMALSSLASVASSQALTGAGATFPYPIYSKWFEDFRKLHPSIEINYQSKGSGAGIQQLTAETVDFGASDAPMSDAEIAAVKIHPLHFPTVIGADVVAYNLPSVKQPLKMSSDVVARIFLGKIQKWNDPALAKLNPGVSLPPEDIIVVHRAESSGTTYIFTDYLSNISPEWKSGPGTNKQPKWPVGIGQQGNEGVAGMIKQQPGTLGYVEIAYVLENHMQSALLQNRDGNFVGASLEDLTAAAAGAAKSMPADFRVSIVNSPGAKAYPISSFTWLLIPSKIPDAKKKAALVEFLKWMLTEGQKTCGSKDYAPLPKNVVDMEMKQISQIQ